MESAKELYCSTSLKKMELITCKVDLKIHSVKSQEIYRLRRYPLFLLSFLTLAFVLLNLIPSGCQIWTEALRPRSPRGWGASGLGHREAETQFPWI